MVQVEEETTSEVKEQAFTGGRDVVDSAVSQVMVQMFGIPPKVTASCETLGPTLTSRIELDGSPTTSLLDIGSPISIVSLSFITTAAAATKEPGQTPAEWGRAV